MRDYWNNLKLFNWNVRYFLIASAVHGFVFFGVYSLLLNLYLLRLGYQSEFIGLVNGLGPLMLAVFSLPAGMISRRWGNRRVMLWSYVVLVISYGLLPLSGWLPAAYRAPWIVSTFALGWISGAFQVVNFAPYMMAWTGARERNYAFALQAASLPVGGFLGNLLGGAMPAFFASLGSTTLESPVPYRNALLVAAFIEILTVVFMKQTTEAEVSAASREAQTASRTPAPYRLMILFAIMTLLSVAGEWTMRVYFNVYLDQALAAPTAIIGTISASAQLMGLTAFVSPQAAARWGRNRVVLMGLLSVCVAFVPLLLVAHWFAVGVGFMILVGVLSLSNPTFQILSQSVVEPEWRTTIASTGTMAIGLGIAITSLGGGYVISAFGFHTLFALGAAAGLLGAGVVWFFLPREPAVVPVAVPEVVEF